MSSYAETDKSEPGETSEDELLEKAKKCFKTAREAEVDQRNREEDDLRFQVPDLQWDDGAIAQRRGGGTDGGVTTPARPMLSISKLDQPVALVNNQARNAQLGVTIHPVSEDASQDTAEIIQGLYRHIEQDQDSPAQQGRLWGLDRAVKVGRGAYRVNTVWDETSPEGSFDQKIVIERILHQDSVYFDPSAQRPDFSDGEWAFVACKMPVEQFEREYPDAKVDLSTADGFAEAVLSDPDWIEDGDERKVLVVEYWYKVHTLKKISHKGRERSRDVVSVKRAVLTGFEVLEDAEWEGKYIPIIPVIGRELQPFSDERRWVGMYGPAKDSQKLYNFAASTLVERMALEPKTPWIMAEGQDEGYEQMWQQSNTRNFPVLKYKLKTLDGQPVGKPERAQLDQTGMSIAMMALQEADNFIQSTTAVYDPSLGRQNPRDKSGKAILALQSQSDAGTSHYLSSLADVSLVYEARVILDLIPAIYDRAGRVVRILGGEDDAKTVMLNAPYTVDQNTKRPVAAPQGQQGAQMHDLRKGSYTLSVSIGKSYQTRLQEGSEEIGSILQASPELMPLIGATYFRFRDFPGSKEIADLLKELREQQHPGLGANKDQGPSPEQLRAQASAMQQQLQQLGQQNQQLTAMLQTEHAKQQAGIQTAQIKASADIEIVRMNNATKLAVARITAAKEAMDAAAEDAEERMALGVQVTHEANQAAMDRAHEVGMAHLSGQQAQQQQAQDGAQDQAMQAGDQAHEGQMAAFGAANDQAMQASDQQAQADQAAQSDQGQS